MGNKIDRTFINDIAVSTTLKMSFYLVILVLGIYPKVIIMDASKEFVSRMLIRILVLTPKTFLTVTRTGFLPLVKKTYWSSKDFFWKIIIEKLENELKQSLSTLKVEVFIRVDTNKIFGSR